MQRLLTFLKACAVMGLTLMGVAMTIDSPRPDALGVGIGVALLAGALIAFMVWARRGSG
jgi:hypothetical protein